MPSALTATDQWPCRWRYAWSQPRQKLTAAYIIIHMLVFIGNIKSKIF